MTIQGQLPHILHKEARDFQMFLEEKDSVVTRTAFSGILQ